MASSWPSALAAKPAPRKLSTEIRMTTRPQAPALSISSLTNERREIATKRHKKHKRTFLCFLCLFVAISPVPFLWLRLLELCGINRHVGLHFRYFEFLFPIQPAHSP